MLRRFAALDGPDRWLVVEAAVVAAFAVIALRLLPFRRIERGLAVLGRRREMSRCPADRLAWAVLVTTPHVPGADTCLVRSIAGYVLLRRRGHDAQLTLGVRKTDGDLEAHGWVETGDGVAIGHTDDPETFERLGAVGTG